MCAPSGGERGRATSLRREIACVCVCACLCLRFCVSPRPWERIGVRGRRAAATEFNGGWSSDGVPATCTPCFPPREESSLLSHRRDRHPQAPATPFIGCNHCRVIVTVAVSAIECIDGGASWRRVAESSPPFWTATWCVCAPGCSCC